VYGIVKQHRGWIEVSSQRGTGTAFEIFLPAVESALPTTTTPLNQTPMPRGTETVLVVEDEPGVRQLIATVLRRLGYVVREAESGRKALDSWNQNDQKIDLLVT